MYLHLLIECFYISLKQARVHLLDTEPFSDAFGPKTKRKRPKLLASDYESLLKKADGSQGI
jgi:nuclear GTP-binding protein